MGLLQIQLQTELPYIFTVQYTFGIIQKLQYYIGLAIDRQIKMAS